MYMVSRHLFSMHFVFGHMIESFCCQQRLLRNVDSPVCMFIIVYSILITNSCNSDLLKIL